MKDFSAAAKCFKAAGSDTRLNILTTLKDYDSRGGLHYFEIAHLLKIDVLRHDAGRFGYHMSILKAAGLIVLGSDLIGFRRYSITEKGKKLLAFVEGPR